MHYMQCYITYIAKKYGRRHGSNVSICYSPWYITLYLIDWLTRYLSHGNIGSVLGKFKYILVTNIDSKNIDHQTDRRSLIGYKTHAAGPNNQFTLNPLIFFSLLWRRLSPVLGQRFGTTFPRPFRARHNSPCHQSLEHAFYAVFCSRLATLPVRKSFMTVRLAVMLRESFHEGRQNWWLSRTRMGS